MMEILCYMALRRKFVGRVIHSWEERMITCLVDQVAQLQVVMESRQILVQFALGMDRVLIEIPVLARADTVEVLVLIIIVIVFTIIKDLFVLDMDHAVNQIPVRAVEIIMELGVIPIIVLVNYLLILQFVVVMEHVAVQIHALAQMEDMEQNVDFITVEGSDLIIQVFVHREVNVLPPIIVPVWNHILVARVKITCAMG